MTLKAWRFFSSDTDLIHGKAQSEPGVRSTSNPSLNAACLRVKANSFKPV